MASLPAAALAWVISSRKRGTKPHCIIKHHKNRWLSITDLVLASAYARGVLFQTVLAP
jgi:hypothetical protein